MIFIYLLICIIILSIFKELVYFIRPYRVVLISTQTKYITPILTQVINDFIKNTNNENFVEIGSGYSKVTRYMAKKYKWHKMIAIEINIFSIRYAYTKYI